MTIGASLPAAEESAPQPAEAQLKAAFAALPPERQRVLKVAAQVAPEFQQAAQALRDPGISHNQRIALASQADGLAEPAADGEIEGSPWLDAAAALEALATLIRGGTPDIAQLAQPYQWLFAKIDGSE